MAKVLLIQPSEDTTSSDKKSSTHPPLGLIYVGTAIEDKHQVKIFDRNINSNDDSLINSVKEFSPDIIGFSSLSSPMLIDLIHLGKLVKKISPKSIVVVGGPHASLEPQCFLDEPYVDYVLRGEGEEAFLEFCDTFDKSPKKLKKLKNVNLNPLRHYLDMSQLKLPNYNLVDISKYTDFYVVLSRGCPHQCTFCSWSKVQRFNGRPFFRIYNESQITEFLRRVIEDYHRKFFFIMDDNILAFREQSLKMLKFLQKYKVHFDLAGGRASDLTDDICRELKKAGCYSVHIGIESGSQRILDLIHKGTTVKQNYDAIQTCKRHGIISDASIMIALPTETSKDLQETRDFIKKAKPDIPNVKIYNPQPAILFDYCIDKGQIEKPKTLQEWANWLGEMRWTKHNVSEISNQELEKAIRELWSYGFYRLKIKKFFFWLKAGKFRYLLRGLKRVFIVRYHLKIPFLGMLDLRKKSSVKSALLKFK